MELILFRHGIAMESPEAAEKGISEFERPLTGEGVEKTERAVMGLDLIIDRLDLIATSPLTRARQTADILAAAFRSAKRAETASLTPGTPPEKLCQFLIQQQARFPEARAFAVVGHEPHLSRWAGWALTGKNQSYLALKKAGACAIEFGSEIDSGAGTLLWLLTSRQLRTLDK